MIYLWYWELSVVNILFVHFAIVVVEVMMGKVVMYDFMVWGMVYVDAWREGFMGFMDIVCIGVTIVRVHLSCIVLRFMVVMGVICWMWVYVGIMGNRIMCVDLDKLIRMWMRVHMGVNMVGSFVDDDWGLVTLHSHTTVAQKVGHFPY